MKKYFIAVAVSAMLGGCAPQTLNRVTTKSYQVGQRIQAAPGGIILSAQDGQLRTVRRWVGILNSPDGWETTVAQDSSYVKKELIYSGISGSTIEIGYREFRGGLAAPAFYQSAKYDLNASKEISFQNFRFRVDAADNNGMAGVLLSDGVHTSTGNTAVSNIDNSTKVQMATGREVKQAEDLAKRSSCDPTDRTTLTGSGPGFETYTVSCSAGDVLSIRCEYGNCRVLK